MILVLNLGSSSLKYSLFEKRDGELCFVSSDKVERIESDQKLIKHLFEKLSLINQPRTNIEAIGCRVVHGGQFLVQPTIVTPSVLEQIRSLGPLAPLHNPFEADIIESCKTLLPNVPVVAVFDTAFHQTIPEIAHRYAIPSSIKSEQSLRRYGFHGIAHQHVSEKLADLVSKKSAPSKLITCHLGNGASVCAVKDGKSIDTSMGFTPMEGLIMGTRSGDIDPGLVLYLIEILKISPAEVNSILNSKSGLLGISGISGDMRVLEEAALSQSSSAEFALNCFAYKAVKYIGSFIAALGGIDAIAFSGGIGEHSALMRSKICQGISCFGIKFDEKANTVKANEFCISATDSKVSVWVIGADEENYIAKATANLTGAAAA